MRMLGSCKIWIRLSYDHVCMIIRSYSSKEDEQSLWSTDKIVLKQYLDNMSHDQDVYGATLDHKIC